MKKSLGIDVGATGIKGAIIDLTKGELITDRIKYPTPKPATPDAMVKVMGQLVKDFNWEGKPIGMGFPSLIKNGVALTASNIDDKWIDFPVHKFLKKKLKCAINIVNDADAAGLAELQFGDRKNKKGIVILLTVGTGIGSAVFLNGKLIPNTELGHLFYKDGVIEDYVSNHARESKDMSYQDWGSELNLVLTHLEYIFSPDRFIIGGGISKKFHKYKQYIDITTSVEPAQMLNNAGIVGAAMAAML